VAVKDEQKVTEKSALATAQDQHEQRPHFFAIDGILGLGNKSIERIAIVRGKGKDFEAAVLSAHKYLADTARKAGLEPGPLGADHDFMGDNKIRNILFRLCLAVDPNDPEKLAVTKGSGKPYPAFPSPDWIRDNLHTDQVAAIMTLLGEVRRREACRPEGMELDEDPLGLTDESMERLIELLSRQLGTDLPERVLAPLEREFLSHFCVMIADKLVEARKSVAVLLDEREQHEQRIEELEQEIAQLKSSASDPSAGEESLPDH